MDNKEPLACKMALDYVQPEVLDDLLYIILLDNKFALWSREGEVLKSMKHTTIYHGNEELGQALRKFAEKVEPSRLTVHRINPTVPVDFSGLL